MTTSRSELELSPAISTVVRCLETLHKLVENNLEHFDVMNQREAQLSHQYEIESAKALVEAEGPIKEREARAKLACADLLLDLNLARAGKRSAQAALRVRSDEVNAFGAALHAHNRELRVLGG